METPHVVDGELRESQWWKRLLATFTTVPLTLAAFAVYGLGTSTGTMTFNSLRQTRTPEYARGRVFAGFDLFWQRGRAATRLAVTCCTKRPVLDRLRVNCAAVRCLGG